MNTPRTDAERRRIQDDDQTQEDVSNAAFTWAEQLEIELAAERQAGSSLRARVMELSDALETAIARAEKVEAMHEAMEYISNKVNEHFLSAVPGPASPARQITTGDGAP